MFDFDLAIINELHESPEVGMKKYKRVIEKAYNKFVRARTFAIGDCVLKKTSVQTNWMNSRKVRMKSRK